MPEINPPIIVSGTRHATPNHDDLITTALKQMVQLAYPWLGASMEAKVPTLVEGEAPGVDSISRYIAEIRLGWSVVPVPAKWTECGPDCPTAPHLKKGRSGALYCPRAGHRRNQEMLDRFPGAPVLCMPRVGGTGSVREQSKGTLGMYEKAVEGGRLVLTVPLYIPDGLW